MLSNVNVKQYQAQEDATGKLLPCVYDPVRGLSQQQEFLGSGMGTIKARVHTSTAGVVWEGKPALPEKRVYACNP